MRDNYRNGEQNQETNQDVQERNSSRQGGNSRNVSPDDKKKEKEIEEKEDEKLEEYGQMTLEKNAGQKKIHLLSIIGEIEGHENLSGNSKATKYDHVLPQLAAIEDNDTVDGMLVLLNTSGGDVDAGLAIAEMIASLSIPTVSLVLGGSHSIGVPLAVSTDYSFIDVYKRQGPYTYLLRILQFHESCHRHDRCSPDGSFPHRQPRRDLH